MKILKIEKERILKQRYFSWDGYWKFNRHNNYHYQLRLPGKVADNEVG